MSHQTRLHRRGIYRPLTARGSYLSIRRLQARRVLRAFLDRIRR